MANKYEVIDESTWERAMHCMVFRNSIEPAFCVTFEADVTEFKNKVKEEGLSFTLAMHYPQLKIYGRTPSGTNVPPPSEREANNGSLFEGAVGVADWGSA